MDPNIESLAEQPAPNTTMNSLPEQPVQEEVAAVVDAPDPAPTGTSAGMPPTDHKSLLLSPASPPVARV